MNIVEPIQGNSLKLTGNKINLVKRPLENQSTASSRCALLGKGYTRSSSTIPLLNLANDEFDAFPVKKRPMSADFPGRRLDDITSSSGASLDRNETLSLSIDGEMSIESGEDTDNLPSTLLFHDLLNEPICSWRNGIRTKPTRKSRTPKKTPTIDITNETSSSGSDTNRSNDRDKSGHTKSADSKKGPDKLQSSIKVTSSNCNKVKTPLSTSPMSVTFVDSVVIIPDNQKSGDTNRSEALDFKDMPSLKPSTSSLLKENIENLNLLLPSHESKADFEGLDSISYKENKNSGSNNITEYQQDHMVLKPGLKTKPPLPKKPDLRGLAKINKTNVSQNLEKEKSEAIAFDMLNYNASTSQHNINLALDNSIAVISEKQRSPVLDQKVLDLKALKADETVSSEVDTLGVVQTSTSTLTSDEGIELKFQNWFKDEQTANCQILENEFHTDLSLHKLKLENQKVHEGKKLELQNNALTEDENKGVVNTQCNLIKTHSSNKNFIKRNMRLSSVSKKLRNRTNMEKSKNKAFVPTAMKSLKDYTEEKETKDVESWMSSNSDDFVSKASEHNEEKRHINVQNSSLPYLNLVDQINELQEYCSPDELVQDDKKKDTTDESDANTYDEIVSILEVLEEQDKQSQLKMESIKKIIDNEIYNDDVERKCNGYTHKKNFIANIEESSKVVKSLSSEEERSVDSVDDCSFSESINCKIHEQPLRSRLSSSTNLNDIFSYLDEVDRNCIKSLACAKEKVQTAAQIIETNVKLDNVPKLEELLSYTNIELSQHIIDLSLRLKDKFSSIALLQKELSGLRNQITKITKDTNLAIKHRLKTQKEDYENVVKRHQKFIDQLIADKKTLNQQCEGLLHEIKVLEDRFNSNLKATEQKHKIEVQKLKEMHAAGEKWRRERWVDTKTQKIKELTIKGLEPELDRMSVSHQQELSELRALHKREIEDLELRSARKMQLQCEDLREQLIAERERAILHEREVLRQRYEQLVSSEEQSYQEQRRRLLAEHANRISECEDRENAAAVERDRATKQAQAEFEDKLQAAIRRHNNELSVLKEKTELEMEAYRNNYKKQAVSQLAEKEMQFREKCRKERDREIEAVIERLEAEAHENKLHMEQSTESRIKRLKEKYEKEISELENSEKQTSSKYSEAKSKLVEANDTVINLRAAVKQLELQLNDVKQVSEILSKEKNKFREIVEDELKREVHILEKELRDLKCDKDKELQQVYGRVKIAVARKDETISELTRDYTSLQEKCAYLENMLEQQRKEYLIK